MIPKQIVKHQKLVSKSSQGPTAPQHKIKAKQQGKTESSKAKKSAKAKTIKKPLGEVQKALKAAQAESRYEREVRMEAERALTAAQDELLAARLELEQKSQSQVRRTSFVVRLMLNQNGECRRMEVEHVGTNRNQYFPGLDGEALVAFMQATINPAIIQKTAPPTFPSERGLAFIPISVKAKSPQITLDIRVFSNGYPHFTNLILCQQEPFIVQTHFQLQTSPIQVRGTQGNFYQIRLYANEVNSARCRLLATHHAPLHPDVLEYTVPIKVAGLSKGLYDLSTVLIISAETKLSVHQDGPMIHVIEK